MSTPEQAPQRDSLQAIVRAGRARAQRRKTLHMEIPGYDSTLAKDGVEVECSLWASYRALTYEQVQEIEGGHPTHDAADTLSQACVDTFLLDADGVRYPLGIRLGLELARFVGIDEAETDRQAVFLIFDTDTRVILQAGQYQKWLGGVNTMVDDELPKA